MKPSPLSPSPRSFPATPRVLVVEDNQTTRGRIARVLTSRGYRVTESSNGREGLAVAVEQHFDAILLDLVMPFMDGWQFRDAQARSHFAKTPTIVMTARSLREGERYALRGTEVLLKPFEDVDLVEKVTRVIGRAAASSDGPPSNAAPGTLYWSKRGAVGCAAHAPIADATRWHSEGWRAIAGIRGQRQTIYQCQQCSVTGSPLKHNAKYQLRDTATPE